MSKLIKNLEAGGKPEFSLRLLGEEMDSGVLQQRLRQVGEQGPLTQNTLNRSARRGDERQSGTESDRDAAGEWPEDTSPEDQSGARPQRNDDVEAIQREAFQQGYTEGQRAGAESTMEQLRSSIAVFGRTVQELASLKNELRQQAQQELVELSLEIARRIVRRELTVDPTTVLALVRTCLDHFERVEIHRVRVNPQDLEIVAVYFQENPAANLEVVADPKLERGGAVFETAQGELDARIGTQFKEIEYGLADG